MESIRKSSEITIRGTIYLYDLNSDPETLVISFEEKETSKRWKGEFTPQYIETLTQKSKSYKKFPIFLRMLLSALEGSSESVIIDLLTYQELEMFRSSRNPGSSSSTQAPNPKVLTKRYLILTFSGEFERVHYPLPLSFEEAPDIQSLQKTISRLKSELDQVRKIAPLELDPIKVLKENEELKQLVKKYEHNQILAAVPRKGAVEIDTLIRESKILEQENERLRLEGTKEVKLMRKENEELQHELDRVKKEMDIIIRQLEKEAGGKADIDEINSKVLLLTQQCEKSQRQEAKYKKEIEQRAEELDALRQSDKKQKLRIKQLEDELQAALKSRSTLRTSSPASRPNPRAVASVANKSPNTRSPRISTRLGTPPGSRENSRGSSRPGSDRIGVRYSPNQRNRTSPNRNTSPSSTIARKNPSPASRLRTPPGRPSPVRKNSPQQSPLNKRRDNSSEDKKNTGNNSEIDAKLKKITDLLKNAKS
jgi:coiled-coil domain-containing protein 61